MLNIMNLQNQKLPPMPRLNDKLGGRLYDTSNMYYLEKKKKRKKEKKKEGVYMQSNYKVLNLLFWEKRRGKVRFVTVVALLRSLAPVWL